MTKQDSKKDKLIPWYFVAFFVVLFAVNAVFITIAVKSYTGVVTENHYEEGINYNENLKQRKAQDQLGWQSSIEYNQQTGKVTLNIADKNKSPITNADVIVYAMRPVQEGDDFSFRLNEEKNGKYSNKVEFPTQGQWQLRVEVKSEKEQDFQKTKRLVVKKLFEL